MPQQEQGTLFEDSEPPFSKKVKQFNANSILISLVLAIASWNLKETIRQGQEFSILGERTAQVTRDMADLRLRMSTNESTILSLQLQMAKNSH